MTKTKTPPPTTTTDPTARMSLGRALHARETTEALDVEREAARTLSRLLRVPTGHLSDAEARDLADAARTLKLASYFADRAEGEDLLALDDAKDVLRRFDQIQERRDALGDSEQQISDDVLELRAAWREACEAMKAAEKAAEDTQGWAEAAGARDPLRQEQGCRDGRQRRKGSAQRLV